MDYTVIGASVNLAAHLEALNRPSGTSILICAATQEAIAPWVAARRLPPSGDDEGGDGPKVFTIDVGRVSEEQVAALRASLQGGGDPAPAVGPVDTAAAR